MFIRMTVCLFIRKIRVTVCVRVRVGVRVWVRIIIKSEICKLHVRTLETAQCILQIEQIDK